ncbi:MAG: AAA family ATPase, partial [Patescibacteria group bacterium]
MLLKRLELSGFKSFAKHAVLQFPSAVTAVVGPNGSGKSNVAEALRWVLGEQSMKSLRGKKGEDLIFNGSHSASKMGRAMVSLVFDNKNKTLPIDFDEVVISRTVHRSGENEYLLNDSPARLKDVAEILSNVGLGASSHHIISQGEADRFLNASPKDRKEMIEEALGLKIYQIKKADAERRLEKTAENTKQVEDLRREIQHQLKFLKKEAEKIEEAEKFKTELREIYSEFIPKERDFIKKEYDKISVEKVKISENAKEAEKSKTAFLESFLTEAVRQSVKDTETVATKEEDGLIQLRVSRNSMEREIGKLEGIMEFKKSLSPKPSKEEIVLSAIDGKEVLIIMKTVGEIAQAGLKKADISEAKKIFEKIVMLAKDFSFKISGKENNFVAEEGEETEILKKKKDEIQEMISAIEKKEKEIMERVASFKNKAEEQKHKIVELEKESYQADAKLRELRSVLTQLSIEEDKIKLRADELKREELEVVALLGRQFLESLDIASRTVLGKELGYQDRENFLRKAERLKIRLENYGTAGDEVLNEYAQAKQRDEGYEKELNDLAVAEKSLREIMSDLGDKIESDFFSGVEKINEEFRKFFVSVFGGGKAELILTKIIKRKNKEEEFSDLQGLSASLRDHAGMETDATDGNKEEETGVEISISHPKKRISSLEMLSGGERSLVAISLLFAMSQVNPPPFLILDETDAALDEANSQKYALMLKSLGEKTQLIVITHNRETMRQADIIYG